MKRAARVLVFIVLCLAAAAGLLLLFPGAKEGYDWSDLPLLAGIVGALLVLAGIWWLVVGRSLRVAAVGWVLLAIPITLTFSVIVQLVTARIEGDQLARQVRVESYSETAIRWPGFDGPVGLDISVTLRHPDGVNVLVQPPEIRMAPAVDIPRDHLSAAPTGGAGYFKDYYLEKKTGPVTLLKIVLFQKIYADRFATHKFGLGRETTLRYHLYPGTIDLLESRDRLCLMSHSAGVPRCPRGVAPETGCLKHGWSQITEPIYSVGGNLTALWIAAGGHGFVADFSAQLTDALRRNSALQNDPDAWRAIQRRVEPEGLERAGYRVCPPAPDTHTASRVCYCRGG